MTAVTMVAPVSIVVIRVVMAVWAEVNIFCGCDSLLQGIVGGPAGVWKMCPPVEVDEQRML